MNCTFDLFMDTVLCHQCGVKVKVTGRKPSSMHLLHPEAPKDTKVPCQLSGKKFEVTPHQMVGGEID